MGLLDDYAEAIEMRDTIKKMVDSLNGRPMDDSFAWYQYHLTVGDVYSRPCEGDKKYKLDRRYVKVFNEAANYRIGKELAKESLAILDERVEEYGIKIKGLVCPLIKCTCGVE